MDFIEICFTLFLGKFVDLVQEEAEIVETFADSHGKGLEVHFLKNCYYKLE